MATRGSAHVTHRAPKTGNRPARVKPTERIDTNALLLWFEMFDARMADLTSQQEALLRDLGAEPVTHSAASEPARELA